MMDVTDEGLWWDSGFDAGREIGVDDGFHRGVRAAIAALYYQAGHLDAVADDLRRRDKCGYAATCERKASRLVMAAMSLEHVRSVAYQEGVA